MKYRAYIQTLRVITISICAIEVLFIALMPAGKDLALPYVWAFLGFISLAFLVPMVFQLVAGTGKWPRYEGLIFLVAKILVLTVVAIWYLPHEGWTEKQQEGLAVCMIALVAFDMIYAGIAVTSSGYDYSYDKKQAEPPSPFDP